MPGPERAAGQFPTTMLSLIAGAGRGEASSPERRRCLEVVVALYYRPVYKHLRLRAKRTPEDAEDLTQAFFARALEKDYLGDYDPARGRFRTFLRLCVDRFAIRERVAARREKRGGGATLASLDFDVAESELAAAGNAVDPERVFDVEWRRALFAAALEDLRTACAADGRVKQLAAFERYDLRPDDERLTYSDLARDLGLPVTTVTNWLAQMRRELRRQVLRRLAEVTGSEDEYRSEAKELFGVDTG